MCPSSMRTLLRKTLTRSQGRSPLQASTKRQVCFRSILQGDHLGVEIACSAHEGFLQTYDLLHPEHRVLVRVPLADQTSYDGLVIDDYFCVQGQRQLAADLGPATPTEAQRMLTRALLAYKDHGILGAPEKDQVNLTKAKVAGAEIDTSEPTLRQGVATVSAPKQKRFALANISFEACLLPATTDALWCSLLGGWSSAAPGFLLS